MYDERVEVSTSGIVGNDIHDTTSEAIRAMDYSTGGKNAQYCLIRGNTVARIDPEAWRVLAAEVSVDDCLLEGTDVALDSLREVASRSRKPRAG